MSGWIMIPFTGIMPATDNLTVFNDNCADRYIIMSEGFLRLTDGFCHHYLIHSAHLDPTILTNATLLVKPKAPSLYKTGGTA